MLSDLVQYFTLTANRNDLYEDVDLTRFLRFVHQYTVDDEIKNAIEVAVHNSADEFVDIYEYGFYEENYLNDIHLGDVLNLNYDNNLVTMLLSCVMHTMNFYVYHEDFDIAIALDDGKHIDSDFYNIGDFKPYSKSRKIDKYINDFILGRFRDYEDSANVGYIDGYTAETERMIVSHIELANKSFARKIRKAYARDSHVREMFNELKYYMVNGEFVFVENYNIEGVGYDGYFDMDTIYMGLKTLHDIFEIEETNNESISFKKSLAFLNRYFYDYSRSYGYKGSFFTEISKCHAAPEGEVIL